MAGAQNCVRTAPGIAVAGLPPSDESRAKENPQQCVCMDGSAPHRSFEAPTPLLPIRFCLSTGFLDAEKKNVRYLGAHAMRGRRRAPMLSTFLMDVPLGMPAVYGLLRPPLHPSQPLFWHQHTPTEGFEVGWRDLKTANRQPRALLRPDSRRRGYLLDLLRIIRVFPRSDRSRYPLGDIRGLLRPTIRPAPVAHCRTPDAILYIPPSERSIRVLRSPTCGLRSTKKD